MSVNRVILLGRLGKDPELKSTPSGQAVCNFSIATDRTWKDKEGEKQKATTWHNMVAWGKIAEVINQYCKKGQQLYIEGRIDNRTYEQDGVKKYASDVVVENFRFISGNSDNGTSPTASEGSPKNDDLPY